MKKITLYEIGKEKWYKNIIQLINYVESLTVIYFKFIT
jgi:hypothetical protein